MKAYSDDLRERVMAACAAGTHSVGAVATLFGVSVSFIHKLRHRQRTTGTFAALPHRGGPAPLLDAVSRARLADCVKQQPDATLAELCGQLVAAGGPAAGTTTVWQALKGLKLRRKKKASTPPSATPSA